MPLRGGPPPEQFQQLGQLGGGGGGGAAPQVPGRMELISDRPCAVLRDYAATTAPPVRRGTKNCRPN